MLSTKTRRVGVFIDVQNMYYSARNLFDKKVNFSKIVEETVGDAQLVRTIAYTISTKGGDEGAFFEALRNSGIEVKSKDLLEYTSGNKKGDWDVGIAIDVVRMLDMLDVVVLVSGDGDFVPLADFVRSRGRIMHVASFRESTSTSLVNASDIYTNFSDDKSTYLIGVKGSTKTTTKTTSKSKSKAPQKKSTRRKASYKKSEPKIEVGVTPKAEMLETNAETVDEAEEIRSRRLSF